MLEWHDGSHRNGQSLYACRGIPGKKIYDKASNSKVRWDCIRSFSLHDQETTHYNNEIRDHEIREGELIQRTTLIHNRPQKIKDAYLEEYGFGCKLCGKSYLKADGTSHIIDIHHLKPIACGERETDIHKDLKGLCPNCHRFVHSIKGFENKTWGEIEKIFKEINKV